MPDKHLPPNKILSLQIMTESVTKDQILGLLSQYVPQRLQIPSHPNEAQHLGDVAYVEPIVEGSAGVSKSSSRGSTIKSDSETQQRPTWLQPHSTPSWHPDRRFDCRSGTQCTFPWPFKSDGNACTSYNSSRRRGQAFVSFVSPEGRRKRCRDFHHNPGICKSRFRELVRMTPCGA